MPSKTATKTTVKATPLVNGQIKRGRTPRKAPAMAPPAKAAPRKPPAKAAPRRGPQSVASRVATLETRVIELQTQLEALIQKHVALATMIQKAAAQQIMNNPQMREKLEAAIMSKMPAL
jgi:hypothetical protein